MPIKGKQINYRFAVKFYKTDKIDLQILLLARVLSLFLLGYSLVRIIVFETYAQYVHGET